MKTQTLLRPDIFLQNLRKKAEEAAQETKTLYLKSLEIVNGTKSNERIILFRNETLQVKAMRYQSVIPKPHYFIRGMEFIAGIHHNNNFSDQSNFWVNTVVKFLIEYDPESTRYSISEEDRANLLYGASPGNLIFEEREHGGEKYGVVKRPHDGSWDTELLIDNFKDFQKLKGIFIYGCKKIGLTDLASPATNKNLIELSLTA